MNNQILSRLFSLCFFVVTFTLPFTGRAATVDLYVTDLTAGTIFKFAPDGSKSIFASGLDTPAGLAFDRTGNLYVAERLSGTILKFAPDGTKSTFASGLSSPTALSFDGLGNLFVTESMGDIGSIAKFTPAGAKSLFTSGGNFLELAFDISGNLFAAVGGPTALPGAIVKFTPDGTSSDFALAAGPGMAFGSSAVLFADDHSGSGGIAKFAPDGGRTSFTAAVDNPAFLAVDAAGNLFVTDSINGEVLKFAPDASKSIFASGLAQPTYLAFQPIAEKLRNLSARGLVGIGNAVLIGGFIVGGNALANSAVIGRAIGPSLSDSGISNSLQDPVLELHDASGAVIASNDDWEETQRDQIKASGLAPTDPHESAIFATLPAGDYTAVVRGSSDTTGIALVEVYGVNQ